VLPQVLAAQVEWLDPPPTQQPLEAVVVQVVVQATAGQQEVVAAQGCWDQATLALLAPPQHVKALAAQAAAMAPGSLLVGSMAAVLVASSPQPVSLWQVVLAPAASSGALAGHSPAPTLEILV
jgi:hypothetical protein